MISCGGDDPSSPPAGVSFSQIDFDASWSKSAKMIAFSHNDLEADFTGIYIMDSSGANKRLIVQGNLNGADWSPGDSLIVFAGDGALFIYELIRDSVRTLFSGPGAKTPKWNRLTGSVAFIFNNDLCIIRPDGTGFVSLRRNCSWPDWSADGRDIYFLSPSVGASGEQYGDTLSRFNTQSGVSEVVDVIGAGSPGSSSHLSASPEGIFCVTSLPDASSFIYEYDFSSGGFLRAVSSLSYSPDFEFLTGKLIYTNRLPGDGKLWVMDSDGRLRKINY